MNKNKKIDMDAMFAQLREEAKPTPIQNLIEARPSGALFALKTSLSTSLTSVKMWIGMACLSALVTTGIVYTTKTATEQPVHSAATKQSDRVVDARNETPRLLSTPESAEHSVLSTPHARAQHTDVATARSLHPGVEKIPAGVQAHTLGRTAGHQSIENLGTPNANNRSEQTVIAETSGITTARYRKAAYDGRMEYASSAPSSFALIEEKFPFPDQRYNNAPRNVSLMVDGLSLLSDIVQLQGEFQISNNMSFGVLLGAGNVRGNSADSSHSLLLAGAQFNYYLLGDFEEGLQIGAQALYSSTNILAKKTFLYENGRVLSLTPYAGYKLVLASGLTMNAQVGIGASTPVFIPTGPSSDQNTIYKWHVSTRMHLSIGWSL